MRYKTLALTTLLFLGISFSNCNSDDFDGCGNIQSKPFFDVLTLNPAEHYQFDSNRIEAIPANNQVPLNEYAGLQLDFNVLFLTQSISPKYFDFSLMNSALACSPIPNGSSGSKTEKFKSITVTTLQDFDSDHLANSNINDLMDISFGDFYGDFDQVQDLNTYLAKDELLSSIRYLLKIKTAPVLSDVLEISVRLELSTGEVFEVTPATIRIL